MAHWPIETPSRFTIKLASSGCEFPAIMIMSDVLGASMLFFFGWRNPVTLQIIRIK